MHSSAAIIADKQKLASGEAATGESPSVIETAIAKLASFQQEEAKYTSPYSSFLLKNAKTTETFHDMSPLCSLLHLPKLYI